MQLTPNFNLSSGSYSVMQFPSGEIQVTLNTNTATRFHPIRITGSILSSDRLMELLQLADAIRNNWRVTDVELVMPYCAYSRQDRICNEGESFSLKVFAQLINSCNFSKVVTWDNHSDVSTALINNCFNLHVREVLSRNRSNFPGPSWRAENDVSKYDYYISPDAGSNKKVFSCSQYFKTPMIRADKIRDVSSGRILDTQVFVTSDQLKNKTVLIIDDICQGGRTFEELAKAIKVIEPSCTIHLYVTHGFFNAGFNKMKEAGISRFITTNSVPQLHTCNELLVLPC